MPGRSFDGGAGYRYGFQGQETDNEMLGGAVAFKYRVHDARIGRFLSVDPLSPEYPWNSPYSFAENKLGLGIELEGRELFTFSEDARENGAGETEIRVLSFFDAIGNSLNGAVIAYNFIESAVTFGEQAANGEDISAIQFVTAPTPGSGLSMVFGFADKVQQVDTAINDPDPKVRAEAQGDLAGNAVIATAGILAGGGLVQGGKGSSATRTRLLDKLASNGTKYTADDVMHIGENSSGKIIFLEKGNSMAGFEHILTHVDDFIAFGITKKDIAGFVFDAAKNGKVVGYQGKGTGRPIYETTYNGQTKRVAVTISVNGFIVGANPVSSQ